MLRLSLLIIGLLLPLSSLALDVRIDVKGLDRQLKANVLTYLSVEREKQRKTLTPSRLRMLHGQAKAEIEKALQPFGYFKPTIKTKLEKHEDYYHLVYRVDAGPQVRLTNVDFEILGEGRDDPRLSKTFPLTKGDILDQAEYDKAKQELLTSTVEAGYLDARYTLHQLRVNMKSYSASIRLHLDSGERYYFGKVSFQQDVMKPEFLDRYLRFKPGDPYSFEKLLTLQANLIDSEYFKNVEIEAQRDRAEDHRVPIDIQLTPNKRDRYRIGLGYSTDTGPRLTLDWKRRRVGPSGHRMQSELSLSKPHSVFKAEYLTPLERPSIDSRTYGFSVDRYDNDTRQGVLALVYGRQSIGLGAGWRRTLGLDYSYETYEVATQDDAAFLLVPNVQWTKLKTDKRKFLQRGHKLDFRIEGAHEKLLSETSYLQFHTSDKFITGIDDDWRLLARAEFGATLTNDLLKLPASKRFYAGGDNSVRGFDLDRLGPTDAAGEVVGGRYLAVGSLELERHLVGKWSAAIFYDAGNAFDPDYASRVQYGAGFGVRWQSPVGPVRVDIAAGLSTDETQYRLHVVVGPEL